MNSQISDYVSQLLASDESQAYSCDTVSSSVHLVNAPIPEALFHDLKALAAIYKRDANCIAGDMLTIALNQALSQLPQQAAENLKSVREAYDKDEAAKLIESSQYDAGGT
ncbi:MAG: hypothetical protein V7752_14625 [Halopseudomonas sp.]